MRRAVLGVVVVLFVVGAIVLIRQASPSVTRVVGSALVIVSLSMLAVARVQLGRAFSVSPQAKALVTHGLYRRIPHPMYAFLDLALLGLIILLRWPWLLTILVLLVAAHVWASRRESRVLEQAFGDSYRTYRRSTLW